MFESFPFTLQGTFTRVQFHTSVAFGIAPSFILIGLHCVCSTKEGVHMGSIFKLQSKISFQGCKRRQKKKSVRHHYSCIQIHPDCQHLYTENKCCGWALDSISCLSKWSAIPGKTSGPCNEHQGIYQGAKQASLWLTIENPSAFLQPEKVPALSKRLMLQQI